MIAEGKLPPHELAPHLEHLAECVDCRTELRRAAETFEAERFRGRPAMRRWWLAAAAVLALVAVVPLVWRRQPERSSIAMLTALAPRAARIVEPRLSGGFAWAPYAGTPRSSDPAAEAQRLELGGAAGSAIARAERDPSAGAQHAAGIAYVLIEKPHDAAERLRAAAVKSPRVAAVWSDLAAAEYAAALQLEQPSRLPRALVAADRAVSVDPRHAEGLFNRALILERLGLSAQARAAWQRYLEVDPASPWAREARTHLSALPLASSDTQFRRDLPRLEGAAAARDFAVLDGIVGRWREQSRAWGEAEFLGRWGEAAQRGDANEAARLLAIAGSLGEALRRQSGETLLADAVAAISGSDPAARAALADAHATYRRGRIAYSRQRPTEAEPELRRAATLFMRGGSPMTLMARYYAANTRFDRNDAAGARIELDALLAGEKSHPGYIAAGALIRWQLSLCHTFDGNVERALPLLEASAAALRLLDERNNLGFVEALLADAYSGLGRPEEAWAARIRSFDALSRDGRSDRLLVSIASVVTAERRAGHDDVALSLLQLEREAGHDIEDHVIRSNTLTRGAVLRAELGDAPGAKELVDEAAAMTRHIADPALLAWTEANLQFARGAVLLHENPQAAMASLGLAREAYTEMGHRAFEVDCHLLRARAAETLGRHEEAAREIDAGLVLTERFRIALGGSGVARSVLDSADELVVRAIRLSLDRGDEAKAFGYAERARIRFHGTAGSGADGIASLTESRLARSGAALLEVTILPEESIAFYVDESGLSVARQPIAREAVRALARRSATGDREAAAALYELFIRPWSSRAAETLIVVPDPLLDAVPFAALYDARTRQHLIAQMRVVRAESAASLRVAPERRAPKKLVAVALPSGARSGSATLPESAAEIAEVSAAYDRGVERASARTFPELVAAARGADVVHLSGHTHDDGDGGMAALDFTAEDGAAPERVPWRTIAGAPLSGLPVVVLAACDTLRLPRLPESRAPSLAGAFLAAGAAEVIGTLRPIGDREARDLFRVVHQQLANGVAPADAVRHVQLQAISSGERPAWSAIAVLTREIPVGIRRRNA